MALPTRKQLRAEKELEEEVYEVVEEKPTRGPHDAPVVYTDESRRRRKLEEVSEAERKVAENQKRKSKSKRNKKNTTAFITS